MVFTGCFAPVKKKFLREVPNESRASVPYG
jgi:hypothetical protein